MFLEICMRETIFLQLFQILKIITCHMVIIHMVKRKAEEGNPGEIGFACCNQINYNNMLSFNVPDMFQDIFYPEIFLSK